MKKCTALLACLALAEFVLLMLLLLPSSPYRNVPSVPEYWARDVLRFLCSLAILAFGAGAVMRRHTTHLVLFECALYIDAAFTLMRCNALCSFLHLGCQLWICYLAENVRAINVRFVRLPFTLHLFQSHSHLQTEHAALAFSCSFHDAVADADLVFARAAR